MVTPLLKSEGTRTSRFSAPFIAAGTVLFFLSFFTLLLFFVVKGEENKRLFSEMQIQIDQVAHEASWSMDEMFRTLEQTSTQWGQTGYSQTGAWEAETSKLVGVYPGLAALFRADSNLIVRWMTSSLEEKKIIGIDLKILKGKNDFLIARETKLPRAGDVKDFTFVQGRGVLFNLPLLVNGTFDGLLIARFNTNDFFSKIIHRSLIDRYYISVTENGVKVFNSFPDEVSPQGPWRINQKIRAAAKDWDISAVPRPEYLLERKSAAPRLVTVLGVLVSLLVSSATYLLLKQRESESNARLTSGGSEFGFASGISQHSPNIKQSVASTAVRILLGTIIFFLMISLAWYNSYSSAQRDIDFTVKEKQGIAEQRLLFDALFYTNLLRFDLVLSRTGMPLDDEIKSFASKIDTAVGRLTGDNYNDLRSQWHDLNADIVKTSNVITHDSGLVSIILKIRGAITRIGNESNLILDSQLDSYYLSTIVLSRLPENQNRLSEIAFSIYPKLAGAEPIKNEDRVQAANIGYMMSDLDIARVSNEVIISLTGNVNPRRDVLSAHDSAKSALLQSSLNDYRTQQQSLVGYITRFSQNEPVKGDEFMATWIGAAKSGHALWSSASFMLETLLSDRIALDTARRSRILLAGFCASLLAAFSIMFAVKWRGNADIFQQQNSLLDLALSVSQSGFWEMNLEAGTFRISEGAKEIFGYRADEIPDKLNALDKILHPDDLKTIIEMREEVIRGERKEEDFNPVSRFYHKDGHIGYIQSRLLCERDSTGKALRIFGTVRDVTALEIARKSAQEASSAKSEFLANMSHELRTPLNSIIGLNRMLYEDTTLDEEHKDMAGVAYRSAENLLDIVNDILDLSKVEAGSMVLESITFSLEEVVNNVLETMLPLCSAKGLIFTCNFPTDDLPYLVGDPIRLGRVMMNLISNAVKYTEKGSVTVDIECIPQDEHDAAIEFSVTDTGIGIAKDKQQLIFEKFAQADASITRRFGGTGLGLAITKQITEKMGGKIGVESEPGKGSRFWISVPFTMSDTRPVIDKAVFNREHAERLPVEERQDVADIHLLVAEDHLLNQAFLRKLIPRLGVAHYEIVGDGNAVLKALNESSYDIVLMDCHMPGLSGYDATREIRVREKISGNHLPIIAMTADAMVGTRERCLKEGMDDYISKPINPDELRYILSRWLNFPDYDSGANDNKGTVAGALIDLTVLKGFVDTEEELHGYINVFIQESSETLKVLRECCTNDDIVHWKGAAHKLKGGAAMLKAEKLRKLCEEAQEMNSLKASDRNKLFEKIETEFALVKESLLKACG